MTQFGWDKINAFRRKQRVNNDPNIIVKPENEIEQKFSRFVDEVNLTDEERVRLWSHAHIFSPREKMPLIVQRFFGLEMDIIRRVRGNKENK